jgi:hypothetical protein
MGYLRKLTVKNYDVDRPNFFANYPLLLLPVCVWIDPAPLLQALIV